MSLLEITPAIVPLILLGTLIGHILHTHTVVKRLETQQDETQEAEYKRERESDHELASMRRELERLAGDVRLVRDRCDRYVDTHRG